MKRSFVWKCYNGRDRWFLYTQEDAKQAKYEARRLGVKVSVKKRRLTKD